MGMTWSEYKAYREKRKKEEQQKVQTEQKKNISTNANKQSNINTLKTGQSFNANNNLIQNNTNKYILKSNEDRQQEFIDRFKYPVNSSNYFMTDEERRKDTDLKRFVNNLLKKQQEKEIQAKKEQDEKVKKKIQEAEKKYPYSFSQNVAPDDSTSPVYKRKIGQEVSYYNPDKQGYISYPSESKYYDKLYGNSTPGISTQEILNKKQRVNKEELKKNVQLWKQIQYITGKKNPEFNTGSESLVKYIEPSESQNLTSNIDTETQIKSEIFNKIMEEGTTEEKIRAILAHHGNAIAGGAYQTGAGLANVGTTTTAGLVKLASNFADEKQKKKLDKLYRDIVEEGKNINKEATYFNRINSGIDNGLIQTTAGATNTVSNVATNAMIGQATGGGSLVQAFQVAGSSAQESLNKNPDNHGLAILTGTLKGTTSYLTEKMFDYNILTRGTNKSSIQKFVNKQIAKRIETEAGRKIASKVSGVVGENLEEFAEDNIDNIIDWITTGENPFKDWLSNTSETVKATTLSTILLDIVGLGGGNDVEIENMAKELRQQNVSEKEIQKAKEFVQTVEKENLKQQNQKTTQQANKDIDQEIKTSQNGFSQAGKTEALRQEARNKLESIKQNYDENSYNQMQEFIETAPSEKALNQVINDLNKETETKQVAPLKQKQEVQLPMQQTTQNKSFEDVAFEAMNNYESNEVESPLKNRDMDSIGKQTKVNAYQYDNPQVKPYFQEMAQQMGEDLAYISSSDNRSTQKGGGTKLSATTKAMDILHNEQGYSYDQIAKGLQNIIDDKGSENNAISKKIELVIDEQLRNGYTNALGKNIEPNQEYINTITEQYSLAEQPLQNNFKYEQSDNSKIDTFRQDASKYWDNSEKTTKLVNTIEKIINDKGYNIRLDDTLGDNVNGRIVTDNQTGETEITINPNSNRKGEFIIGHELTHAIETKEMVDLVKSRMEKDGKLRNAVEDLKKLYGTDDINAEVLADISGQLFGNQEFINNLSVEKPSVFKRFYDAIVSLANKITGNSSEALFIKDLKNKWEKAYRENNNNIREEQYSMDIPQNVKDIKNMNEFLRKAIENETDKQWKDRLKDAQMSNYSRNTKNSSPLQYKREVVQQYLDYKIPAKDNKGRTLSPQQKEYFKDSVVRNDKGELLEVYHGTPNPGFTEFRRNVNYFTDNQNVANTYTGNDGVYKGYVDIQNPIRIDANKEVWSKIDIDNIKIDNIENVKEFLEKHGSSTWREQGKIRTSTADLVSAIEDAIDEGTIDADGIIIENIYDEGAYGSSVGKQLGTDYITFKSNQFKNTDNLNPTINKDIRYSLSENGAMKDNKTGKKVTLQAESMNDGKNLLAIHNLTEDKLKGVLELGGFPVPSIAITNPDIVDHSQFGDISVIFNKETINPENSKNEVYDRDVWSPTFPQVDYQINTDNSDSIAKDLGIESWRLEDYAEDSRNPDDMVGKLLRNSDEIVEKYIKDNNLKYETKYREADITKWYNKQDSIKNFIKEKNVTLDNIKNDKNLRNQYFEELRKEFSKDSDEVEAIEQQIDIMDHFLNENALDRLENLKKDFDILTTGENKVVDNYETNKEKLRVAKENGIEKYIKEQISSMFGERGIRNNLDPFTPSGNRRSFWALHDEYNIDNIIKAMTNQDTISSQNSFMTGFGKINAQMSQKFNSISDIKANENRIVSDVDNEAIEHYRDIIGDDISDLAEYYKYASEDNFGMQGFTNASESVFDLAKSGNLTEENFRKILEENIMNSKRVPTKLINRVIDNLNNLKDLKTDYFEAKPQRAVGFDEIDAIIIPKDLSKEVKQQLKDRGIKTIEYDSNNENERADILKSLNEYKFSKTSKSWQEYLEKNYKSEGTTTDLRDIRLPMKEKQEVTAPMKQQEQTKVKFDNEVMKTNSEIKGNSDTNEKVAKILSEPVKQTKPEQRTWAILKANFIDKGAVFEKLSQKTKNRDLQGKYDYTLSSGARGQYAIGNDRYTYSNGKKTLQSKSLTSIIDEVGENTQAFNEYMYHQLNVDRMTLDERFGIDNKPVFGDSVTADMSRTEIAKIEEQHPEFKKYAEDVYQYLDANKQELVDKGVISQETSDMFKERYPHYVPIQRITNKGNSINVPLDTARTGINTPIKKAKGGNQDINPLFQTMANQTLQTYRASARNNFGLELKNTLQQINQLSENNTIADIDEIVDTMTNEEQNNELLQKGKKGENPTFTVFDNGQKVTYEISQDMYDALKPKSELLNKWDNTKFAKAGRKISNFRRGVLTEYNPIFSITNAIKDAQDVLVNSQHAGKTYAKFPEAYAQILKKGYWYNEYIQNGGEQSSYFTEGDFENIHEKNKAKNILTFPLQKISDVNNVIEMAPRLAEYIVSRENGKSIETAMLDASRVTTNFKAGGDITKFANRNGATFLNASVQGFQQQVRNIQEANMKGLKGWTSLALKYTIAGLPALLLNNLFWDDDDDYEQLQDYVKDNYYVIAKLPNGNFLRVPKGRMTATIQKVVSNVNDFVKDGKINSDDVASTIWNDLKEDIKFGTDNLAPNNPIENNILSPIFQVANNKTWYGEDLVPQRLQDVPKEEQADETTDKFSKWLGEKLKVSPIKINYLLDQYSGGIGDVLLPLGTPQAENNVIEDKFTTDPVMKSQYPADFFNKRDELNVRNNSLKATDEDKLKYKYISSIQSNISNLYKQKREIQASDKTDKEKKAELKKVQKQINELARESLETVDKVEINGNGAKIGGQEYYKKNGTWTKLTEKEKDKLNGTSTSIYSDYQNSTSDLSDTEKIQKLRNSNYSKTDKSNLYEKTISTDKYYPTLKKSGIDIDEYMDYKLAQSNGDFTADKKNGRTVMGSGKKKVLNYLNKNITGYGNRLLIAGKQYSLTASQRKDLSNYINKTFATQAEKTEVYKQLKLNFVVNGNKVTYK